MRLISTMCVCGLLNECKFDTLEKSINFVCKKENDRD